MVSYRCNYLRNFAMSLLKKMFKCILRRVRPIPNDLKIFETFEFEKKFVYDSYKILKQVFHKTLYCRIKLALLYRVKNIVCSL